MSAKEFLLQVSRESDGYVATCYVSQPRSRATSTMPSEGHGRTELSAMINALMNGQVQDYTETETGHAS